MARVEMGLDQADLGALLHIDQNAVSKIERGKTDIRFTTLKRLAAVLHKEPDWFYAPVPALTAERETTKKGRGRRVAEKPVPS